MSDYQELKALVNKMDETLARMAQAMGIDASGGGGVARVEIAKYMMYLAASDGEISWEETRTIYGICGVDYTPSQLGEYIRDNNIYSTAFEQTIPTTLTLLVEGENILLDAGNNVDYSNAVIQTYKAVGEALMKSDGLAHKKVNDYNIYIRNMEEYRSKHSKAVFNQTVGYAKGGAVIAPAKDGVPAPKKG